MSGNKMRLSIMLCTALAFVFTAFIGCSRCAFLAEELVLEEPVVTSDPAKAGEKSIAIGGSSFLCTYDGSNRVSDYYRTGENGFIIVDPETGEIYGFADVSPFERIEGAASLADDALISAVKERIAPLANTQRYNETKIDRHAGKGEEGSEMVVELHRSIDGIETFDTVIVRLSASGDIIRFSKAEGFPDDLEALSIPDNERDRLIKQIIEAKLGGREPGEAVISEGKLTMHKGKPAMIYYVTLAENSGEYLDTVPIVIFRK